MEDFDGRSEDCWKLFGSWAMSFSAKSPVQAFMMPLRRNTKPPYNPARTAPTYESVYVLKEAIEGQAIEADAVVKALEQTPGVMVESSLIKATRGLWH
jgi:ABC-type branched-subunit amino acid transport system substrate-binding protein